jgi:hypothetical protein
MARGWQLNADDYPRRSNRPDESARMARKHRSLITMNTQPTAAATRAAEALAPFAEAADSYDPPFDAKDSEVAWSHDFTIGSLRRAREARAAIIDAHVPQNADEQTISDLIKERDHAEDWADKLAAAISDHTGYDIGEHSNMNNPWEEALEAISAHVPAEGEADVALDILLTAIADGDSRRVWAYATRYFAMKADYLKAAHCRDQLKTWGSTLPDDLGWLRKEARAFLASNSTDTAFSLVDATSGEPCPTHGKRLCTITDKEHRHVAAHMWRGGEQASNEDSNDSTR